VTIRTLTAGEAGAVLQLWQASGLAATPTDSVVEITRAISHPHVAFLVAVQGDALIGSLIGASDGWRGNMYRLAVHPQYRRKGIGRALVAEAERFLRGQGVWRITALVEAEHAWAAQFWESVGYLKDERIARYGRHLTGPAFHA
jgi:ribosomal protein S18 acetylase RimI-like enzyme